MLTNTFAHIPGIGLKTEKRLWSAGIHSWDNFVEPLPIRLPANKVDLIRNYLNQSKDCLSNHPEYFVELLPSSQHWRLFPHFRHTTVYLDIETTGLNGFGNEITTIAMYDGTAVSYYVNGENLEQFEEDITKYDVIVTYNGKSFDIPFIETFFRTRINQAHIDLRYILKNLGYSGGLKGCEKQLGLDRGVLDEVDGYFAVLLWHEYQKTRNRKILETLLAYNIEDVVNLEVLMVEAYNRNVQNSPFSQTHKLPTPRRPELPFSADVKVIDKIRRKYGV